VQLELYHKTVDMHQRRDYNQIDLYINGKAFKVMVKL